MQRAQYSMMMDSQICVATKAATGGTHMPSATPAPSKSWISWRSGAPPPAGVNTSSSLPGPPMSRSVARYWSPNACLAHARARRQRCNRNKRDTQENQIGLCPYASKRSSCPRCYPQLHVPYRLQSATPKCLLVHQPCTQSLRLTSVTDGSLHACMTACMHCYITQE